MAPSRQNAKSHRKRLLSRVSASPDNDDIDNDDIFLTLGDVPIAVTVRRNARARRIILRVDGAARKLVMTLPRTVSVADGLAFAEQKSVWIRNRLALSPAPVPFADGAVIPVLGVDHTIRHCPDARGGVWQEQGHICVSGAAAHLPRRVQDWLRTKARRDITDRAHDLAQWVDRPITRISVRDTRSRWGSCSSTGGLNFSWRLIMAPDWVLTYVVAHEVAHLVHMNHSAAFWAVVDRLVETRVPAQKWLRLHGAGLHRYGAA